MDRVKLRCQICHVSFSKIFAFKSHVHSHGKKIQEIFPNESHQTSGLLPFIVFMKSRKDKTKFIGLSHLTFVFGGDLTSCFYLCHVCHLKNPVDHILGHICSSDHFTNFLSITDPNSLTFSWIPQNEINRSHLCAEHQKRNGELQMLHLPRKLISSLTTLLYADVMQTLSQNEKLFQCLQDALPETDLIQTYQKDPNRQTPLLGLHHIVECVCAGLSKKRYYLCTLCKLPVAAHMIVKHVLCFDHVFRYFEEWHPSSLLSKATYVKDPSFTSTILDLAKQAEEIQGCTHMKHLSLEPDEYKSVNFKSYPQALEKLELIKKCSLQINIKPGKQLVCRPASSTPAVQAIAFSSFSSFFEISCQVCGMCTSTMYSFKKHLEHTNHLRRLVQVFNDTEVKGPQHPALFNLGMYCYIQGCIRRNKPVVGIPMIVSCISTEETEALYLCFACLDHFGPSCIQQHLTSEKHLMLTLYQYQDPEVLPFAWNTDNLDTNVLAAKVWEMEKAKSSLISMKVIDLPYWILCDMKAKDYIGAVETLEGYDTSLTNGVPLLKRNEDLMAKNNFPLLGKQFLVTYEAQTSDLKSYKAVLCLLCQRKLNIDESYVHIFCQQHIIIFLEKFHPGSLNSSNVNAKCLLDLAQQAQKLHPTGPLQMIYLTRPVWDGYTYHKTTSILKFAEKQDWRKLFKPKIQPKGRLVPTWSVSTRNKDHVRGHSVEQTSNVKNNVMKKVTSEQKLSLGKEDLQTSSEVEKKSGEESHEMTKEESKQCEVKKTSQEFPESSQNRVKEVGAHCKQKEAENKDIFPAQLEKCSDNGLMNKRSISMCGGSREDMSYKRPRFMSEGETGQKNQSATAMEKSHYLRQDDRLSKLYDCRCDKHDSIYLCEFCSLKIPQEELSSHITGTGHPKFDLKVVNLEEDIYSVISKQSFESVIQMVSVLLTQSDGRPKPPSTPASAPPTVKQEEIYITLDDQHVIDSVRDHIKVENLKTEVDLETSETAASIFAVTSNTIQTPELKQDVESHVGTFDWATQKYPVPPDHFRKLSEADSTLNSDLESPRSDTTLQVDERISFSAVCTATSSSLSPQTDRAPDSGSALQHAEPTLPKGSTEVHEALSAMDDKTNKYLEPAPSICHKLPKSVATAKKSTPAVKKLNHVKQKVNVSPHTRKIARSAAPQVTAAMPGRPDSTKQPKKLPVPPANKTKPIHESVKIGEDQVIVLRSPKEKKQQVYCQLCSVRLQSSDHLREMNHQYNYVQLKMPWWTAKPSEDAEKFQETVAMLAKKQRSSSRKLEVMIDVYEEVNRLPVKLALERLKEMLRQKSLKGSSSTANSGAALQKEVVIGSPCEVTSSDDGVNRQNNRGCVDPQLGCPESTSTFFKTPATPRETPVSSEQQPGKVPQSQDTRKIPGDAQKTSEEKFLGWDPHVEPAADDEEVQSQSSSSCKEAHAVKLHTRLGRRSSAEEMSRTSIGFDVEKNRGCVSYAESTSPFSKIPATSNETPVGSEQQPVKVPDLQDTQKTPVDSQKTSDVMLSRDLQVEAAADEEVQNQSSSASKEDQAVKPHARPGRQSSSEELSTISIAVGVDVENNRGCAKLQVCSPESSPTLSKTPETSKDTPVSSQQQPRKVPELQDTQKNPGDAQKTSEVKFLVLDPHVEPAAADEAVQSHSRSSCQNVEAAKPHARPGRRNPSEELSTISIGERIEGKSRLSTYLSLKKLDTEPIIGQGTVWECQGTSQMPFFLCESCEMMLGNNSICQHMISHNHKFNYLQKQHTVLLHFWTYQDLLQEEKMEIFDLATQEVAKRERVLKIDAKIVLLRTELYQYLQKAPFTEALELLQSISERKLRVPVCLPSQKSQQLESRQSLKLSLPTRMQSASTPEKDQRRKNAVKQKHVTEATMNAELQDVQKRKASSPSKADTVIAPPPQAATCIHPKNTCANLSVQKKVVSPASQHQTQTVPVLAANRKDEASTSPSPPPVHLAAAQTLPLPNRPTRKRPADTSVETLVRSCSSNSPKNSSLTKPSTPPLQPVPESSSVSNSSIAVDAPATPLSLPLEPLKSISDQQNIPSNYFTALSQIINAMRAGTKKKFSALDTMKPAPCRAITPVPRDERRTSPASECIERNTTDKNFKNSGDDPQNQLLSAISTSVAIRSLFENNCVRHDPLLMTTESEPASGVRMSPAASTASLAHPQGSTGQPTCSAVAAMVTEPEMPDACPINTITGRGCYTKDKSPGPTEVSSDPQAASFTGLKATTPAAYVKYGDSTYGESGHAVHKSPINFAINSTFTSPPNMVVTPPVDSAVNPTATTIIATHTNAVNASAQSHATSVFNPHASSVVNPTVNLHVNSAVILHAVGHPHMDFAAHTVANPTVDPPLSSQSSYQSAVGLYPSQIQSEVNYLHLQTSGTSSAVGMEPMWTSVQMQQSQYQQQCQYYQQQQRYRQHEYYRQQQQYRLQQYLLQQQQFSNQQQNQN